MWQKKNGINVEIRAQRFNPEGEPAWSEGGVVLASVANGQGNGQSVVSDGAGNFFFAWDTQSFEPRSDIYVQKIDGSGHLLWETGILASQKLQIRIL